MAAVLAAVQGAGLGCLWCFAHPALFPRVSRLTLLTPHPALPSLPRSAGYCIPSITTAKLTLIWMRPLVWTMTWHSSFWMSR